MDSGNLPLVSVVTPVYNGEKYIDECIRSVLSQTYQNWEYIILNNCSTDRTLEIANKYAAKDNRIHIYNTDTLLPIMKNWNFSLRQISPESKYCKVVHADDLLFSQCLEKMVSLAQRHPSAGVIGSYGLGGDRVVCRGLPTETEFISGRELCRLNLLNRVNCFWSPTSLMIRSDLIQKKPEYYNEKNLHADVQSCYETLRESDFGFVHQILTFIRKHEESVTSTMAAPYSRFIVDNLDHLLTFGPVFLNRSEYRRHLRLKTKKYYYFLSNSVFELRERKFWRYHINSLAEIGFPFRYSMLLYAVLRFIISNPLKAASMLKAAAKKKFSVSSFN